MDFLARTSKPFFRTAKAPPSIAAARSITMLLVCQHLPQAGQRRYIPTASGNTASLVAGSSARSLRLQRFLCNRMACWRASDVRVWVAERAAGKAGLPKGRCGFGEFLLVPQPKVESRARERRQQLSLGLRRPVQLLRRYARRHECRKHAHVASCASPNCRVGRSGLLTHQRGAMMRWSILPRGEPMNLGRYTKIFGGARALAAAAGWVAISACGASADVAASGSFVATKDCPAFQSFRKGTNPGGVKIETGHSYPLLAKNASNVTHYRIRIDGASPPERWVSVDCGSYTMRERTTAARIALPSAIAPLGSIGRRRFYLSAGSLPSARDTLTSANVEVRPPVALMPPTSRYMASGLNHAGNNIAT